MKIINTKENKITLPLKRKIVPEDIEINFEGGGITPEGTLEITENGTVDVTNYASANVNVLPNLQEKTITENGEVIPDEGYDGLSKVSVNVASSGGTSKLKAYLDETKSANQLFKGLTNTQYVDMFIEYNDTENVTSMYQMFYGCSSLLELPLLNTSNVTNMGYAFYRCYQIENIPEYDTKNVTDMSSTFYDCKKITSIPLLDTSNVTNMGSTFNGCELLTSIPLLNTSKATKTAAMFYNCKALTTIPLFDTSNVTDMGNMFYGCTNLETIPNINVSNVTNFNDMFRNCTNLKSILMYGMVSSFNISSSTKFEREDLVTILNNLGTVTTTKTLTMGTTNLEKLTEEDKAIATGKGWTLA